MSDDKRMYGWLSHVAEVREKLEKEFEDAGVIAYFASETQIMFIMANGSKILVEGFFYPEGAFMEVNGEHLPLLTD